MGRITLVMLVFVIVCMITHRGNWSAWKKIIVVPAAWIVQLTLQLPVAIGLSPFLAWIEPTKGDRVIVLFSSLPVVIFAMRYSRLFVRPANQIASQSSDIAVQSVDSESTQIQPTDEGAHELAPAVVAESLRSLSDVSTQTLQPRSKVKISAKEIVADIKSGMTSVDLKDKYGLTDNQMQSVLTKLKDKGLLKDG